MDCTGTFTSLKLLESRCIFGNSYVILKIEKDSLQWMCSEFHITFTDGIRARFVDNTHNFSGRVQVYKDGTWGEICSADLSDNEAKVLCSMMGFK